MTGESEQDGAAEAGATRRIGVEVETDLAARFATARRICETHGKRLDLADVVQLAMEAAIREVETTFGAPVRAEAEAPPPRPGRGPA